MSWRGAGVLRCSSQGEIGLFNQVQAIEYSAADYIKTNRRLQASVVSPQKPAQKTVGDLQQGHEKKSRPRIITIGSPEREGKNENSWSKKKQPAQGFGEFLEACFLCKKKLLPDQKDVYMYQYYCLAAFCSRECRTDQMAVDGLEHEISTDLPRFMTSGRPVRKLQRPREFYLGL